MMRRLARKWAFKPSMVADAPETAGVYALWDGESLLCLGHASGGADTIRGRLTEHMVRAAAGRGPIPTHYSWEICRNPRQREAEARAELQGEHTRQAVG
jgi:hypothetical protein